MRRIAFVLYTNPSVPHRKGSPQKTILVIEDDHDSRVTLRTCLETAGFDVITATNGARALDLLEKLASPPVAILLDLNLPIMTGDEFLKRVKSTPRFATIPIIQMSAAAQTQRPGMHAYLAKPFSLDDLLKLVLPFA